MFVFVCYRACKCECQSCQRLERKNWEREQKVILFELTMTFWKWEREFQEILNDPEFSEKKGRANIQQKKSFSHFSLIFFEFSLHK